MAQANIRVWENPEPSKWEQRGKHSLICCGIGILNTRSNGKSKTTLDYALDYTYTTPLLATLAIAPR